MQIRFYFRDVIHQIYRIMSLQTIRKIHTIYSSTKMSQELFIYVFFAHGKVITDRYKLALAEIGQLAEKDLY